MHITDSSSNHYDVTRSKHNLNPLALVLVAAAVAVQALRFSDWSN